MIFDVDEINYDYDEKNNAFYLTYKNIDFCILAKKLKILDAFIHIVEDNNGNVIGIEDEFYSEKDIENAISELRLLLEDVDYQADLIMNALTDFSEEYIRWEFFMLTNDNIHNLLHYIKDKNL